MIESVRRAVDMVAKHNERQVAWRFFIFFSRFEYALKKRGYFKHHPPSTDPGWDIFGNKLDPDFKPDHSQGLKEAVEYFEGKAPQKQKRDKTGKLTWEDATYSGCRLTKLLNMICAVRNNLFHGGKEMRADDRIRDRALMEYATVILEECLRLDEKVHSHFIEGFESTP